MTAMLSESVAEEMPPLVPDEGIGASARDDWDDLVADTAPVSTELIDQLNRSYYRAVAERAWNGPSWAEATAEYHADRPRLKPAVRSAAAQVETLLFRVRI